MRTLIPFLFWSLVYILLSIKDRQLENINIFKIIFNNVATNIFWFFFAIFGIYLSVPVLSLIAKKENFKTIEYFCILSVVFNCLLPVLGLAGFSVYGEIVPAIVKGYLGYVFLGWLIKHENYSKKVRYLIYLGGLAGLALMFFGTYYLSLKENKLNTFFMDYNSIACYSSSAAIMLLAKHINWQSLYKYFPQKYIRMISSTGLGVYVTHMLILPSIERIPFFEVHPVYFIILGPIIIYLIVMLATLLLKKIPVIKFLIHSLIISTQKGA